MPEIILQRYVFQVKDKWKLLCGLSGSMGSPYNIEGMENFVFMVLQFRLFGIKKNVIISI